MESDQPGKEEAAWSMAALGGCCIHSCRLKVGAARRKSEFCAIACFLVPASTFIHSPRRLETSVTEANPAGEPRTHSKVFEVHECCLRNVLSWMGMFHFDYIFTDIFLVTLCYPCTELLIQSVKKTKIKKRDWQREGEGREKEKIENTGPLDLGKMALLCNHLEGNQPLPHQIWLCVLWLELEKSKSWSIKTRVRTKYISSRRREMREEITLVSPSFWHPPAPHTPALGLSYT